MESESGCERIQLENFKVGEIILTSPQYNTKIKRKKITILPQSAEMTTNKR